MVRYVPLLAGLALAVLADPSLAARSQPPTHAGSMAPRLLDAKQLADKLERHEPVLIVDVRKQSSYERRHIRGAADMPSADIATWGPKLTKKELVVLYCS